MSAPVSSASCLGAGRQAFPEKDCFCRVHSKVESADWGIQGWSDGAATVILIRYVQPWKGMYHTGDPITLRYCCGTGTGQQGWQGAITERRDLGRGSSRASR